MKMHGWGHSESSRLAIAAFCAVAMHVSLACLPVQWRPILPTPTVLRVTLTPPPPTPVLPVPQPVSPVATAAFPPESPVQAAPPSRPEPAAQPVAIARTPTPPKVVQAPPKPKRPPELRKPLTVVQSAPTPKPKPPKLAERPPLITAKTPAKESVPRPERSRPIVAKTIPPHATDSERENAGGRTTRADRKAWDEDFDAAPSAGRLTDRINKPGEGGSGTSAAAASAPPTRFATLATSLRPLPGNPKPRYPDQLRQRGIEGQVLVRLTVSAAGSVESASVARSSGHELLDQEARATVLRWRFQPLEAPKVAQLPITFRLQN